MYCLVSLNSTIHFFHDQINICEYEIYFHYNFNHFKANSLLLSVECLVTDGCSRYVSLFVAVCVQFRCTQSRRRRRVCCSCVSSASVRTAKLAFFNHVY